MVGQSNAVPDAKALLDKQQQNLRTTLLDKRSEAATEARLVRDEAEQADFRQAMISSETANPDDSDASMGGGKIARQDGAAKIRDTVRRREEARKAERSGTSAVIRNLAALQNMRDYLGNMIAEYDDRISEHERILDLLGNILDITDPSHLYDENGNLHARYQEALEIFNQKIEDGEIDYEYDPNDPNEILEALQTLHRHTTERLDLDIEARNVAREANRLLEEIGQETNPSIREELIRQFVTEYENLPLEDRENLRLEARDHPDIIAEINRIEGIESAASQYDGENNPAEQVADDSSAERSRRPEPTQPAFNMDLGSPG